MTNGQVGLLLGFSALLAAGQTLFKVAASSLAPGARFPYGFVGLLAMPVFWSALLLYGCGTLLWIYILQSVPLSRAYPFAALGFVIVPGLAFYFFSEKLNLTYALGTLLIVAGVLVTSRA